MAIMQKLYPITPLFANKSLSMTEIQQFHIPGTITQIPLQSENTVLSLEKCYLFSHRDAKYIVGILTTVGVLPYISGLSHPKFRPKGCSDYYTTHPIPTKVISLLLVTFLGKERSFKLLTS